MGEDDKKPENTEKTELINFAQEGDELSITSSNAVEKPQPAPETQSQSSFSNPDLEETIVTNIDDEPTVVVTAEDEKTAVNLDISEPEEKTSVFDGANLDLRAPGSNERCDPRKVRSVLGTFKVYVLRKGQTEEYVFNGLRKKDYTETEIRTGFEEYCEIRDNFTPPLSVRLKNLWAKLTRRQG